MSILFYDHLINKKEIDEFIQASEEADNQKGKAAQLIDDIIFQGIVAMLLEKLEERHHHTFLNTVHDRPYDPEILAYLKDHIGPGVEDEIKQEAEKRLRQVEYFKHLGK